MRAPAIRAALHRKRRATRVLGFLLSHFEDGALGSYDLFRKGRELLIELDVFAQYPERFSPHRCTSAVIC